MEKEKEEFVDGYAILDSDWQLVTWQEGIQEFAKGKKLIATFYFQKWTFQLLVEVRNDGYLAAAIEKGKWYVKTK